MAQTGDIMGNHDTVLWNISLHYTKQSPYFPCSLCTGAPKFPTIFPHKHRPIRLCNAQHTLPYHGIALCLCLLLTARVLSYLHLVALPTQSCFSKHAQPLRIYIYIYIYLHLYIYIYTYIHIIYIYTHTYNHIFHYSVAMLSSVCRQPNCLSHSLQSHAPQKRWVGGTRAVALLITMVYNTCN